MNKIILLLFFTLSISINAQTVAWSSDSEDLTGWGISDNDEDTFNWGTYTGGGESIGFNAGAIFFSESWHFEPAPDGTILTPDNYLFTPIFTVPITALSISYKMKVASNDPVYFAEKFAVYVYDDADTEAEPTLIHEETLTEGGDDTAKDIIASIPASFAGKTLGILIRHYDCTNENQILVDDFEVSYSTTLSIPDNTLKIVHVSPNPVRDVVKINTNEIIDNISITNQLGQRVIDLKKEQIFNNSVNLSTLKNGVYFITVRSKNKLQSVKIIKE